MKFLILSLTVVFVFAEYSEHSEQAIPSRLLRTVEEANDFIISNQNKVKDRDVARRDWETPEFGEREGFRRYGWPRLPWRRPVQGWGRQGLGRGEWGREG